MREELERVPVLPIGIGQREEVAALADAAMGLKADAALR